MTATTNGNLQAMFPRECDAGSYVAIVSTSSDKCRALVDQSVVQGTNIVVVLIARLENGPGKLAAEPRQCRKGDLRLGHWFALDETEIVMRARATRNASHAELLVKWVATVDEAFPVLR